MCWKAKVFQGFGRGSSDLVRYRAARNSCCLFHCTSGSRAYRVLNVTHSINMQSSRGSASLTGRGLGSFGSALTSVPGMPACQAAWARLAALPYGFAPK